MGVLAADIGQKRTLFKMNAFDLVVTVALGSTLATVLLSKSIALANGVLAFALVIGLQGAITWLSVRSSAVRGFVKAEPTLLLHRGRFLRRAMKLERVTEAEILAVLRGQGIAAVEVVEAVVLETDSSLSVVRSSADAPILPSPTLPTTTPRKAKAFPVFWPKRRGRVLGEQPWPNLVIESFLPRQTTRRSATGWAPNISGVLALTR